MQYINQENKCNPLSDQESRSGSRKRMGSPSKYREVLNIPSSSQRKEIVV